MEKATSDRGMSFRQMWKLPVDQTIDGPISRDGRYIFLRQGQSVLNVCLSVEQLVE
jgi:hypothetical protein